jgi:hypothetical protein
MKALGLAWRREIPTEHFEPTAAFYRDVMGLKGFAQKVGVGH